MEVKVVRPCRPEQEKVEIGVRLPPYVCQWHQTSETRVRVYSEKSRYHDTRYTSITAFPGKIAVVRATCTPRPTPTTRNVLDNLRIMDNLR
jgi:hypothetical protein